MNPPDCDHMLVQRTEVLEHVERRRGGDCYRSPPPQLLAPKLQFEKKYGDSKKYPSPKVSTQSFAKKQFRRNNYYFFTEMTNFVSARRNLVYNMFLCPFLTQF